MKEAWDKAEKTRKEDEKKEYKAQKDLDEAAAKKKFEEIKGDYDEVAGEI